MDPSASALGILHCRLAKAVGSGQQPLTLGEDGLVWITQHLRWSTMYGEHQEEQEWQRTAVAALQSLTAQLEVVQAEVETTGVVGEERARVLWDEQFQLKRVMDVPFATEVQPTLR